MYAGNHIGNFFLMAEKPAKTPFAQTVWDWNGIG